MIDVPEQGSGLVLAHWLLQYRADRLCIHDSVSVPPVWHEHIPGYCYTSFYVTVTAQPHRPTWMTVSAIRTAQYPAPFPRPVSSHAGRASATPEAPSCVLALYTRVARLVLARGQTSSTPISGTVPYVAIRTRATPEAGRGVTACHLKWSKRVGSIPRPLFTKR